MNKEKSTFGVLASMDASASVWMLIRRSQQWLLNLVMIHVHAYSSVWTHPMPSPRVVSSTYGDQASTAKSVCQIPRSSRSWRLVSSLPWAPSVSLSSQLDPSIRLLWRMMDTFTPSVIQRKVSSASNLRSKTSLWGSMRMTMRKYCQTWLTFQLCSQMRLNSTFKVSFSKFSNLMKTSKNSHLKAY